jgi:xanthine/CO dehydrogenase XdhC/CoxF family maturation factor
MSHNFLTDKEALRALLPLRPSYLGLLGPKQRKEQLLEALKCEGYTPSGEELRRLYTPVGLDIGAVSPQEIALATAAEILAVLNGRNGGSLRHRESPIHAP